MRRLLIAGVVGVAATTLMSQAPAAQGRNPADCAFLAFNPHAYAQCIAMGGPIIEDPAPPPMHNMPNPGVPPALRGACQLGGPCS